MCDYVVGIASCIIFFLYSNYLNFFLLNHCGKSGDIIFFLWLPLQDDVQVHFSGFRTGHFHNLSELVQDNLGAQVGLLFFFVLV